MSRWISIDDYFAAAGESWATVGNTRPDADHCRSPRAVLVDEDQEQADTGTAATPTSARSTRITR